MSTAPDIHANAGYIAGLRGANGDRSSRAAARDVMISEKILAQDRWDARQRAIARTRAAHPGWTWAEIGASLGLTKDQAVAVFRRMAMLAGLRAGGAR